MDRDVTDEVFDLRASTESVRHVAHAYGPPHHVDEIVDRMRRVDTHSDAAEAWAVVLAGGSDTHLRQRRTRLHSDVGDREGEARGHRRQQELGGLHAGVGATARGRLINPQLELADPHCAAVPTLPACRDLHPSREI